MKINIWLNAEKLFSRQFALFAVLIVFFIIIYYLASTVFAPGNILSLVGSVVSGFIIGWYVSTLYCSIDKINSKAVMNYLTVVLDGFRRFSQRPNVFFVVLGLFLIGGIFPVLNNSISGLILQGFFTAAGALAALLGLSSQSKEFDPGLFTRLFSKSQNSGIFATMTVLIAIIPVFSIIQIIMLPIATIMIEADKVEPDKVEPDPSESKIGDKGEGKGEQKPPLPEGQEKLKPS